MNKRSAAALLLLALLTAFVGALATAPAAAQPVSIPAGDDGWVTQGGGATMVDLSQYPIADVFPDCGSGPQVNLAGSPLDQGSLGSIDTIVSRPNAATINALGTPVPVSVTIVALSMVSESNFMIGSCGPFSLHVWNSGLGSAPGTMNVTLDTQDGGTFDSTFNVTPKLVFTDTGSGAVTTIDCGALPSGSCAGGFSLSTSGAEWVRASGASGGFSAQAAGLTVIKAGLGVDGSGSGQTTYTTLGNRKSNFYPGVTHTSPYVIKPAQHSHQVGVTFFHQNLTAQDCANGANSGAPFCNYGGAGGCGYHVPCPSSIKPQHPR